MGAIRNHANVHQSAVWNFVVPMTAREALEPTNLGLQARDECVGRFVVDFERCSDLPFDAPRGLVAT